MEFGLAPEEFGLAQVVGGRALQHLLARAGLGQGCGQLLELPLQVGDPLLLGRKR